MGSYPHRTFFIIMYLCIRDGLNRITMTAVFKSDHRGAVLSWVWPTGHHKLAVWKLGIWWLDSWDSLRPLWLLCCRNKASETPAYEALNSCVLQPRKKSIFFLLHSPVTLWSLRMQACAEFICLLCISYLSCKRGVLQRTVMLLLECSLARFLWPFPHVKAHWGSNH